MARASGEVPTRRIDGVEGSLGRNEANLGRAPRVGGSPRIGMASGCPEQSFRKLGERSPRFRAPPDMSYRAWSTFLRAA